MTGGRAPQNLKYGGSVVPGDGDRVVEWRPVPDPVAAAALGQAGT